MRPSNFQGSNCAFGWDEKSPVYPAEMRGDKAITCWKLTAEEIEKICDYGEIWITFKGQPLQQIMVTAEKPEDL